jgi:carboxylate-amine ligase
MEFRAGEAHTVGMELELQLLDARTRDLVDGILSLVDRLKTSALVKPEMIQNTVEIISPVCRDGTELHAHMRRVASEVREKCAELGMAVCGAGTHPFSQRLAVITPTPRYLRMERAAGFPAYQQITYATHVHIGMTSGDEAITLMRALKPYLPLLIALSANSPFWRGHDTDCATYRQRILAATRSYGVPPAFNDWAEFNYFFKTMQRAGVFETINDIHWDIRPRPHLGTLEVRVMDAQPSVAQAVMFASFVRLLVAHLRAGGGREREAALPQPLPWWIEKENHFQATRHGLEARYVRDERGTVSSLREVWQALVPVLEPHAAALGESRWFDGLRLLAASGPGYARQRRRYRETGSLEAVVTSLVEEFERDEPGIAT